MESRAIETATEAGIKLAQLTQEVSKARKLVEETVADTTRQAQRAFKRGYVVTEEKLEEATSCIKTHPWQSVAVALGAGVVTGLLFGWSCSRSRA